MTTVVDGVRVSRIHHADVDDDAWRRAVGGMGHSHLAHAPEWAGVIRQGYGHEPLYLTAEDGTGPAGVLPAFIVRRPLGGTIVTSMPFLDGGGPCGSSATLAARLVERLFEEARREKADVIELRCTRPLDIGWEPLEHKVNMVLPLPGDAEALWHGLDRSARNQVRKAERAGLVVEIGGAENLDEFYAIFAARMRDLGSPVHARRFLRATLDAFGERARVALVRKGPTTVGGLVALAFKDIVTVPWAACAKEHFALCPNMLLYWEAIRTASIEGFRQFDFGRSTRGSGTYRFKRQWGALEAPLFWYRIPANGTCRRSLAPGAFVAGPPGTPPEGGHRSLVENALTGLWQRLPLDLTKRLGPPLRKYLIQ